MPDPQPTAQPPEVSGSPAGMPEGATSILGGQGPQPAAPPQEKFGQGFARGLKGEQYVVDAQGNMTNSRATAPSKSGTFGSILAGAVFGAMAGASKSRPGGIPSHELGGGVGAGTEGARDAMQERDVRNRAVAQKDFERKNTATDEKNKDLMYKANLHIMDLNAIKTAHDIAEAERNDPLHHEQLKNAVTASQLEYEKHATDLGLINERTYDSYAKVPQSDIEKFNRQEAKVVTLPDGTVKVWDRTHDARRTPNAQDFEMRELVGLDPKSGKPEWRVTGHVKAGQGTEAQWESQLEKERTSLLDAATKNAANAKTKAETAKDYSQVALNNAQAKLMGTLGVDIPPGYKPPTNLFSMDEAEARDAIVKSGITAPADFSSLYAVGHYDGDLKTFTTTPRKGMPTRDRNAALSYIRTFINPNFREENYDVVKGLEKEFASTRPNTAGGNLISFNAAIGHLNQLYDASQALAKHDLTALNAMANAAHTATGKDPQKVYNALRSVLAGEAGRLFKQAAPDVKEMEDINTALNDSSSPDQFKGVTNAFAHTFLTKGASQIWHYYNYTGHLPPSTFDPPTIQALQKMGIDPRASFPENAQVSAGGTGNQNPTQPTQTNAPPKANAAPSIPPGKIPFSLKGKVVGYADDKAGANYVSLEKP